MFLLVLLISQTVDRPTPINVVVAQQKSQSSASTLLPPKKPVTPPAPVSPYSITPDIRPPSALYHVHLSISGVETIPDEQLGCFWSVHANRGSTSNYDEQLRTVDFDAPEGEYAATCRVKVDGVKQRNVNYLVKLGPSPSPLPITPVDPPQPSDAEYKALKAAYDGDTPSGIDRTAAALKLIAYYKTSAVVCQTSQATTAKVFFDEIKTHAVFMPALYQECQAEAYNECLQAYQDRVMRGTIVASVESSKAMTALANQLGDEKYRRATADQLPATRAFGKAAAEKIFPPPVQPNDPVTKEKRDALAAAFTKYATYVEAASK